uniref:tRNA pseudouridine synthase B n=1 Tax=Ammonifex degensii TaxID=42838 RepID=A0A7C1IXQ7_9THEO
MKWPVDGVVNVLKPPGMTSHDVVDWMRRLTGLKRIGHTGTLDPGACGVLVLLLGRATRAARFLADDKEYRAEAIFGIETDTQDIYGKVTAIRDASALRPEEVTAVLPRFLGRVNQMPPPVSAVHYRGERLYRLARTGKIVTPPPRTVEIYSIEVLSGKWGCKHPRVLLHVACSKGTYVRALVAEIGRILGYGATLSFLLRTRVGCFAVGGAYALEELAALGAEGRIEEAVIPVAKALNHLPVVTVKPSAVKAVRSGGRLYRAGTVGFEGSLPSGTLVRLVAGQDLLAVARLELATEETIAFKPVWVYAS